MCHRSIAELSDEYRENARDIEQLVSQRLLTVTQARVCEVTGADKNKVSRLVANDLDLIAGMLATLGLKVVDETDVYCSVETAEATRSLLKNCFNSPDYMRILFK